jgi:hypothetical protein
MKEMRGCLIREEDRFVMLASTVEQIIPTMTDAEANYALDNLKCLIKRGTVDWAQQIAADLIVLLHRRKL